MKLNLLIMGPAGAGKGTMSDLIRKHFRIAHISTGDMFREELKKESELGLKAKDYMSRGLLVPDELTIDMVLNRLNQPDCEKGYLLDGFPRSLIQANVFDTKVINTEKEVSLVINLTVDEEILFERIENRRVCRNCGKTYNVKTLPSKVEGICDDCGGELYQRADDNHDSLVRRMESYHQETAPVLEHYRRLGLVRDVNATQTIEKVWFDLENVIDDFIDEKANQEVIR